MFLLSAAKELPWASGALRPSALLGYKIMIILGVFLPASWPPSLDLPEPIAVFLFYDGESRPGEVGSFLRMSGHTWLRNQSRAPSGDLMNNLMINLLPLLKRF